MASDPRDTPAMKQYFRFKQQHPDCLLMFRMGDFYEMFDQDAVLASKAVGLTLTQRSAGMPMAGMPYHQLETYLKKFVSAGIRVAVCDQIQDPATAKGIVERAVTRLITPGTLLDEALLDGDSPNVIASICFPPSQDTSEPQELAALAIAELSTGQFHIASIDARNIADELVGRSVRELLYPELTTGQPPTRIAPLLSALGIAGTPQPQWHFRHQEALESLREQFGVSTLAGFGLRDDEPAVLAAGALVRYLRLTQMPSTATPHGTGAISRARATLAHLQPPRKSHPSEVLTIDATTLRALEIDSTIRNAPLSATTRDGSLIGVFSSANGRHLCSTAMGKRLLRQWLCRPLRDVGAIHTRQRCVQALVTDRQFADELTTVLKSIQDVPRIAARVALRRCTPRDLVALGESISTLTTLIDLIQTTPAMLAFLGALTSVRDALTPVAHTIINTCVPNPPPTLREGGVIRDGIDPALDEARQLQVDSSQWMASYQATLIKQYDLPNLKVGFNKIFGYFIELPKAQSARAPDVFSRRQTLTNAERYITPELKNFEDKVLHAQDRALAREQQLFEGLCDLAATVISQMNQFADAVAQLDVLSCFAHKAAHRQWICPTIVSEPVLSIVQGRHPVVEELLEREFVPNDVTLGSTKNLPDSHSSAPPLAPPLALITGPNMAGKSTFIRQTALITLLAHTGSFVPAQAATVGITDRIFARVGADDALALGQSTFMVEMIETANILHHATNQSLIILDEIGRGTSTLDGLSLAWAIAETLSGTHNTLKLPPQPTPRTLFATHYHELTNLADLHPHAVMNLHVQVRQWQDQVVFLHRIVPGRAEGSFGIHVAKLAGIPQPTITRAAQILESLSVEHSALTSITTSEPASSDPAKPGKRTKSAGHINMHPLLFPGHEITFEPKPQSPSSAPKSKPVPPAAPPAPNPLLDQLSALDLNSLSPLDAFDHLRKLKALASNPSSSSPANST